MKVAVIGAGAMGCIIGGLLAENGHGVTLVDVWKDHVEAINREGLKLRGIGGDRVVKVAALSSPEGLGVQDLIVIMVKSPYTKEAVQSALSCVGEDTLVLTLQNGLGNADTIAGVVGPEKVVAGVTSHGGTVLGVGEIRHAGKGETVIAAYIPERREAVKKLASTLTAASIETRAVDSVDDLVWGKLMVNVGINAFTAVLGVKNGELAAKEPGRELVRLAVSEAAKVARAKGIEFAHDPVEHCLRVAEATAENVSSMLQDVRAKRRTEIDVINGAIVREGERLGVETPVNKLLVNMVKLLELAYDQR